MSCVLVCLGHDAEKRLAQLETLCKEKEEERVELELRLTEVKENLKKSLARGALAPPNNKDNCPKVSKDASYLKLLEILLQKTTADEGDTVVNKKMSNKSSISI